MQRRVSVIEQLADVSRRMERLLRQLNGEAILRCVECGASSDGGARGWRAYRADLDEGATYCPDCAEREFGSPRS